VEEDFPAVASAVAVAAHSSSPHCHSGERSDEDLLFPESATNVSAVADSFSAPRRNDKLSLRRQH